MDHKLKRGRTSQNLDFVVPGLIKYNKKVKQGKNKAHTKTKGGLNLKSSGYVAQSQMFDHKSPTSDEASFTKVAIKVSVIIAQLLKNFTQ